MCALLRRWLARHTLPQLPVEVVRGERALRCRREVLGVRIRHAELMRQARRAEYGSEEYRVAMQKINENIERLDGIEARYFGPKG